MNFAETEIRRKSAQYAKQVIKRAREHEPQITADLQKILAEVAAEMVGLEHKFKLEKSLTGKIVRKIFSNMRIFKEAGFSFDESFEKAIKLQSKNLNDALRYTMLLPLESYLFSFRKVLERLKRKGFVIPKSRIWNAWKNIKTKYDKGYRGINVTIISSQEQIFELQFHTKESFHLKMEMHELYKEAGLATVSDERKREIIQIMVEAIKNISIPKGVVKL